MPKPRRLLLGLLALVGFVAPMDSIRFGGIGGLADVVLLAALAVLVFIALASGKSWPLRSYAPVLVCAAGLAFAGLIGTFFSPAPTTSLLNIARFTVAVWGMMVLFANAARTTHDVKVLMWSYVLGATTSAVYGFIVPNRIGRAQGLSFHPNALGLTCVFAMALLYGLLVAASTRVRWAGLVLLSILGLGVLSSGSRAAVVAAVAATAAYLVTTRNRRLLAYGMLAVAAGAIATLSGLYALPEHTALDRLFTPSELTSQSDEGRARVRNASIEQIDAHPLTGSGFANATTAHNLPLQVLQAGGALGLIAFAGLVVTILRPLIRRRRDPLVAGSLAMYCGYLATAFASNTLWDRWLWFPITCGLALHAVLARDRAVSVGSRTPPAGHRHEALGGGVTWVPSTSTTT